MNNQVSLAFPLVLLIFGTSCFATLVEDRAAMERVYHEHRIGTTESFEEALPESLIRQLVEKDLHKEHVLETIYGITITETQIEAEIKRINASTRAPDMLEEIKNALGNENRRFADTVVRPLIVEKILRAKYENDDKRHAETREAAQSIRRNLLSARPDGIEKQESILIESGYQISNPKWIMTPREKKNNELSPTPRIQSVKGTARGGRYAVESSIQVAQVLESPAKDGDAHNQEFYFEELHPELQEVLNIQLQKPGDVSAVIERPTEFHLFLLINRTARVMYGTALTVEKRNYEQWLSQQPRRP